MQLAARVGAWHGKKLPYDAEVEWLESTGTQYIDTGIVISKNGYGVEIDFTDRGSYNYCVFCGSRLGGDDKLIIVMKYKNMFHFPVGSYNGYAPFNSHGRNRLTLKFDSVNSFSGEANDLQFAELLQGTTVTNKTMNLFWIANSSFIAYKSLMRLHSFAMFFLEDVILDSIPVRFTNENGVSEGAMYDRVSGQLFRNAGTGAFVIGPDKAAANGGGVSSNA